MATCKMKVVWTKGLDGESLTVKCRETKPRLLASDASTHDPDTQIVVAPHWDQKVTRKQVSYDMQINGSDDGGSSRLLRKSRYGFDTMGTSGIEARAHSNDLAPMQLLNTSRENFSGFVPNFDILLGFWSLFKVVILCLVFYGICFLPLFLDSYRDRHLPKHLIPAGCPINEEFLSRFAKLSDNWAFSIAGTDTAVVFSRELEKALPSLKELEKRLESSRRALRGDLREVMGQSTQLKTLSYQLFKLRLKLNSTRDTYAKIHDIRLAEFQEAQFQWQHLSSELDALIAAYLAESSWSKLWDRVTSGTYSKNLAISSSKHVSWHLYKICRAVKIRILKLEHELEIELSRVKDDIEAIKQNSKTASNGLSEGKKFFILRWWWPESSRPLNTQGELVSLLAWLTNTRKLAEDNLHSVASIYKEILVDAEQMREQLEAPAGKVPICIIAVTRQLELVRSAIERFDVVWKEEYWKLRELYLRISATDESFLLIDGYQ